MGVFDNPSAGRFDPPPGAERFEPPRPARRSSWLMVALGLAVFVAQEYDRWSHPRGPWAAASIVLVLLLAVLHGVVRHAVQPDEHAPYSHQQHVTR